MPFRYAMNMSYGEVFVVGSFLVRFNSQSWREIVVGTQTKCGWLLGERLQLFKIDENLEYPYNF